MYIVVTWSRIEITYHRCKWINCLLSTVTIWQFRVLILRIWSIMIVTYVTTCRPQRVMLCAILFWLRLQSTLGRYLTSSIVWKLLLQYGIPSGHISTLLLFIMLIAIKGLKQNRESTEGYSKSIVRKDKHKFGKGLVSTSRTYASPKGTGPGVRRSKRPLSACHTRCRCSMETNILWNVRFSKNVKSGNNVTNW